MQTPRLIRELYVPREVVFDAWTGAEHLTQWYVPHGCKVGRVVVEPTPGGRFEVNWTDVSGATLREWGTFSEITRPEGFLLALADRATTSQRDASHLRLTLEDRVDACQIVLSQEPGPGRLAEVTTDRLLESYRSAFREQWERRLDRLEAYFSAI